MKTVLLLRHAKSSWDHPNLPDFQRPLAPRGKRAAPLMAAHMAEYGLVPHRVLCSAAHRAKETWDLVASTLETALGDSLGRGIQIPVDFREDIYHASIGSLLSLVRALEDEVNTVLLVGHNPTFEDLAHALAGSGDPAAMDRIWKKYPTGSLAVIDFPVPEWADVQGGEGYLRAFVRPKDLTGS